MPKGIKHATNLLHQHIFFVYFNDETTGPVIQWTKKQI